MSNGWNRKERYMLKKDNMTGHIKFLSYWIKTTIPLFNFTITQKDTNNRSCFVVVAATTNTFNSSKMYCPFSLWPVPISF
jgi:hypothetical protein